MKTEDRANSTTETSLSWTGERVIEGETPGNLFADHLQRYRHIARHAAGKTVLDIACGTGYGSHHLRRKGARVVFGVDISVEAVSYARQRYSIPGVHFLVADGTGIPFPDRSIELIACFETIEHVPDYQGLLDELKRVLLPDGVLCMSTPNVGRYRTRNTSPGVNKYHVREFAYEEICEAIRDRFARVYVEGQRFIPKLASLPGTKKIVRLTQLHRGIPRIGRLAFFHDPYYFIFWCSQPKSS